MEEPAGRTPDLSLEDTFLRAVAGLPGEDLRAGVVAEALGYLQQGFDAHYAEVGRPMTMSSSGTTRTRWPSRR